jgi:hypothetical protein
MFLSPLAIGLRADVCYSADHAQGAEFPNNSEVWVAVHNDLRHAPRIQALMAFLAGCLNGALAKAPPSSYMQWKE